MAEIKRPVVVYDNDPFNPDDTDTKRGLEELRHGDLLPGGVIPWDEDPRPTITVEDTETIDLDLTDGVLTANFIGTIPSSAHNDLTGIQGGTTGQYYHLTSAELAKVGVNAQWGGISGTLSNQTDLKTELDKRQYLSSGMRSIPTFTDLGTGSATIGSGYARLFPNSDGSGLLEEYNISGITAAFTDAITNYVIADYNSGTPIFRVTTNVEEINVKSIIPVYTVYREATTLHYISWDSDAYGLAPKLMKRFVKTARFERESGLTLSESTGRIVNITSGRIWYGANELDILAFTSATDTLEFWYHSAGNWTSSTITQWPNTQYDNGTNLVSISGNKYACCYVYRSIEIPKISFLILGNNEYTALASAEGESPTLNLPSAIRNFGILTGKIIFKNGEATATEVQSAFAIAFSSSTTINHNDTAGIQGGTTNEYYHLTSAEYSALHAAVTVSDTTSVDLTLTGQQISATVLPAGVDHNSLQNYDANRHFLQSDISAVSSTLGTGLLKTTSGTLSVITDNSSNWNDAYSKRVDTWTSPLSFSSNTASIADATTSGKGAVQLSNSYTGSSQTLATTEKALSDGLGTKENTLTKGNLSAGSSKISIGGSATNCLIGTGASVDVVEGNLTHNNLGSKQGGTTNEYYHLTSAQYSGLHDAVTVSDTSSVDLSITGQQISATVLPAGVDHNSLSNLAVGDVHTQYALLAGRSGGQTLNGGSAASENLTLSSTANATKGSILFGTSAYDEVNNRLGIGIAAPTTPVDWYVNGGNGRFLYQAGGQVKSSATYTTTGSTDNDRMYQMMATVTSDTAVSNRFPRGLFAQLSTAGATSYGGTTSDFIGLQGQIVASAVGVNLVTGYGLFGRNATQTSITQTNAYGLGGEIQVTAGNTLTSTDAACLVASLNNLGTIAATSLALLELKIRSAGTLSGSTNFYGLYVPSISGAANNYSIYTNTGKVYFGDKLGILTTSPTYDLSFGGNVAREIWMERHTTTNTAGNNLTVQAGGSTSGSTNKNGGNLLLQPGISTGNGGSYVSIYAVKTNQGSGTTDRNPVEFVRIDDTVKIGDITTNYTEFEADGTMKAVGTATTYNDIQYPIETGRLPAANAPTWSTFNTNFGAYTFAVNDYVDMGSQELIHTWKEDSQIEFHIHWATNGTDVDARYVKWQIEYCYAIGSSSAPFTAFSATTTISAETTIPAATTANSHIYTSIGTFTPSGGKIGMQLKIRLKRIAASGTAPSNNPFALQVGIHIEQDTLGSRTTSTK